MTVKEFWHLKYGAIVEEPSKIDGWGWTGKVVKREVIDEWTGQLFISKSKTIAPTTGRKILEITFEIGKDDYRYLQSNRIADIKKLKVIEKLCDRCKKAEATIKGEWGNYCKRCYKAMTDPQTPY